MYRLHCNVVYLKRVQRVFEPRRSNFGALPFCIEWPGEAVPDVPPISVTWADATNSKSTATEPWCFIQVFCCQWPPWPLVVVVVVAVVVVVVLLLLLVLLLVVVVAVVLVVFVVLVVGSFIAFSIHPPFFSSFDFFQVPLSTPLATSSAQTKVSRMSRAAVEMKLRDLCELSKAAESVYNVIPEAGRARNGLEMFVKKRGETCGLKHVSFCDRKVRNMRVRILFEGLNHGEGYRNTGRTM